MSNPRLIPFLSSLVCLITGLSPLAAVPIKFLPWDDSVAARKIGFSDGKETVELQDLHPDKRSNSVNWTSSDTLPQLIALDKTSPDGKAVSAPIKLSAAIQSPLVLILPDKSHPSGMRCHVIEDDSRSFGWGSLRFINATGKDLAIREEKVIKALPKSWKPVDIDPRGSKRNIGVQLAAREDLEAILYSSVWEYDPEIRKLIIVLPGTDVQTGALDLKIIPEDRRASAPPTETP